MFLNILQYALFNINNILYNFSPCLSVDVEKIKIKPSDIELWML